MVPNPATEKSKHFLYVCSNRTPCKLRKEAIEQFPEFGLIHGPDTLFNFRTCVLSSDDTWSCVFSVTSNDADDPGIIQPAICYDKDTVITFCIVPFLMLEIGELDILWLYDDVALNDLEGVIKLWETTRKN